MIHTSAMNNHRTLKKIAVTTAVWGSILTGFLLSSGAPETAISFIAVTALITLAVQDYRRAHYNFRSSKRHY